MKRNKDSPFVQTYTGRAFYPLDPDPDDLSIIDIAHALSNQCRYAGHVNSFYSVAEHSVIVSKRVDAKSALAGLLHDASEAYLVDLPKPLKSVMPEYAAIEDRLMRCIAECFGFAYPLPEAVHIIDQALVNNERKRFMNDYQVIPWSESGLELSDLKIVGLTPTQAKWAFLDRYEDLQ